MLAAVITLLLCFAVVLALIAGWMNQRPNWSARLAYGALALYFVSDVLTRWIH